MAEWRDHWIEIGLSCAPLDLATFEEGARGYYAAANVPWPDKPIIVVPCPLSGALAVCIITDRQPHANQAVYQAVDRAVYEAVHQAVYQTVYRAVHQAVDRAVDGAVHQAVEQAVYLAVHQAVHQTVYRPVHQAVYRAVNGAVHQAVDQTVYEAVYQAVDQAVYRAVNGAVHQAVDRAVGRVVTGYWDYWLGGRLGAEWPSLITFFLDVCGLVLSPSLMYAARASEMVHRSAGRWWPDRNWIIVSRPPLRIERDAQGRLHSPTGLAIEFSSGWGVWQWHGVQVSKQIILCPETITPDQFMGEQNAEIRRVIVERLGVERIEKMCGSTRIDAWNGYELLMLKVNTRSPAVYLKMKNPSVGCYHLGGVPPTIKTCREALNWRIDRIWNPDVLT